MNSDVRTAIVLQGGGALGAYEYGVMKALYELRGKDFKPAVITGVSIGAINAAILAGSENPIDTLDNVWRERLAVLTPFWDILDSLSGLLIQHKAQQYVSTLGNASMYRLRPEYFYYSPLFAPLVTSSIYDTSPLHEMLTEIVDWRKLNSESRVVVTAVNVESGELARFGNTVSIDEGGEFNNGQGLSSTHVVASGSLPPGFPMTEIDGNLYWDGGLHSNTPLSEAINCLERCDGGSHDVRRELIVVELVPMDGEKPRNIQEVLSRFFNLIFASKLELDETLFNKYHDFVDLIEQVTLLIDGIEANEELKNKVNEAFAAKAGRKVTIDDIRRHSGTKTLTGRRKIDFFTKIPFTAGPELRNASDFSRASIEARIEAGYQEAINRNISKYKIVEGISRGSFVTKLGW